MIRLMPRSEPLAVAGMHASGEPARALARLLAARPAASRRIAAVSSGGGIIATGDADALPWIDGATWLGREPEAPSLLVPTCTALTPHARLVLALLERRYASLAFPLALIPRAETIVIVPLGGARSPGGEPLAAWIASSG